MSGTQNRSQKPLHSPITKGGSEKRTSFRKRAEAAPLWDDIPAQKVHSLICACTTRNASPTFGYTRDGSALVLAVYYQDQRYVDYLSGEAEFDEYLAWLSVDLLNLTEQENLEYFQNKF